MIFCSSPLDAKDPVNTPEKVKPTGTEQKEGATNNLSEVHRKQTAAMLKKQYGDDFPQQVIDIVLDASTIDPKTGNVNVGLTPGVIKQVQKAGFDPVKIGLITEAQAKQIAITPKKGK